MALTEDQKRRYVKYFKESVRHHPDWPVIVSEGDSWYSFPLHANTVDCLDTAVGRRISLLRLERSADELLAILSGRQRMKLRRYLGEYGVQALLLSGGGNDVAGEDLFHLLRRRTDGAMSWEDCLNKDRFQRRFEQLYLALREVVDLRDDVQPDCVIYMHGYDYAIPSGEGVRIFGMNVGPWLKPSMVERGIDDPGDRQKIVDWIIDSYNGVLQRIAGEVERFVHVDLRGTLAAGDWHDELHPERRGFQAVAEVFRAKLRRQFPGTF